MKTTTLFVECLDKTLDVKTFMRSSTRCKMENNVMTDIQVVNIEENLRIKGVISRMQNFS